MIKKVFVFLAISSLIVACTKKVETVSLSVFAEKSKTFVTKIATLEAKLDPTNIDTFMQINDSISAQQQLADSAITALYTKTVKDTIFLNFTQTKNLEKIKILKVWVIGAKYNELEIQASVQAMDNSSFMGPYTSATMIDKTGKRIEVGGGIGGSPEEKLVTGKIYTFNGSIDNLHLLGDLKSLNFDEDIKKW